METYHQGKFINDVHKVLLLLAAPRTLQVLPYMTRDCLQILLLTFKQIKANEKLIFLVKSSENHKLSDDFMGNRS